MSRSDEFKLSYVRLGQVMTMTGPVRTGKARLRDVISGQVRQLTHYWHPSHSILP